LGVTGPEPLLRDADFRRWYVARSVSVAGTTGSAVALPLLVYSTSGSAALTAAITALEALPYLLFGLLAGATADRRPRRRMMVRADLANAVLLATVPATHLVGGLRSWHVLAVAFGVGVGFCWFDAAAWGALPRLVGKSRLPAANGLIWSTGVVIGIVTPAGAALLATATHPSLVLAVNAACYLVSASLIRRLRRPLDADGGGGARTLRADIAAGLRYIWRQPVIRTLSIAGFGLSMAGGGAVGLLVVHADNALGVHSDDPRVGLLYTAGAIGSLGAAWLLPRLGRTLGEGVVSVTGYLLFAAATVALAAVGSPPIAMGLWLVWEFAFTMAVTNGITVRQQLTPDELQGRVNTTGRMIAWGGTPFGALIGGLVAQEYGIRVAYLALALPVLVGVAGLVASPVRRLRVRPAEA
jgi:MFS family permease